MKNLLETDVEEERVFNLKQTANSCIKEQINHNFPNKTKTV